VPRYTLGDLDQSGRPFGKKTPAIGIIAELVVLGHPVSAVRVIAVADQEARVLVPWRGRGDLPPHPGSVRLAGDVPVQDGAAVASSCRYPRNPGSRSESLTGVAGGSRSAVSRGEPAGGLEVDSAPLNPFNGATTNHAAPETGRANGHRGYIQGNLKSSVTSGGFGRNSSLARDHRRRARGWRWDAHAFAAA
jgi:hypothetical protein